MDRIYMTYMDCGEKSEEAKIAVFLKGTSKHVDDLLGFLKNQNIDCSRFPDDDRIHMEEFTFFDDGFFVSTTPAHWSFYELRNYIQTYANTWDENYLIQHSLIQGLLACDEGIDFDDSFYLEISKKVDACEDRYYLAGKDLGQFFDGIQKLIRNNLNLYWVAVEYIAKGETHMRYQNHVPATLPRNDVEFKLSDHPSGNPIKKEISFNGEVLAHLYLCPGPFSPKRKIIHEFVDYIILHIDDFVYGVMIHEEEISRLKAIIEELAHDKPSIYRDDIQLRDRRHMRLLLIGALQTSENRVRSIFKEFGFVDVTLVTDYAKMKGHNANNLLKMRGHYDGLLLGPMPHKMRNTSNLISQIEHNPNNYPPYVVLRNHAEKLKITKTSLREGIKKLQPQLETVCLL